MGGVDGRITPPLQNRLSQFRRVCLCAPLEPARLLANENETPSRRKGLSNKQRNTLKWFFGAIVFPSIKCEATPPEKNTKSGGRQFPAKKNDFMRNNNKTFVDMTLLKIDFFR